MNWLDLRKIYERSKHREKRKKELRNEVERRFPHLSNRKYVIALAGDRKVEWRPDFIKQTGGLKSQTPREQLTRQERHPRVPFFNFGRAALGVTGVPDSAATPTA
jgi:hypothetical protein